MFSTFWENLSERLAQTWLERLFGPSFLFWAGGLALWIGRYGWPSVLETVNDLPSPLQVALLIAGLLLVAGSDLLLETLDLPILRLLEGYWLHPPLAWLVNWRIGVQTRRYQRLQDHWQYLKGREDHLSPAERQQLGWLETEMLTYPADPAHFLPTRLGNLLRAAEEVPRERFGLDPIICWPYLWILLPEAARQDLIQARLSLDRAAQSMVWGGLFLAWTWISPWAVPIALFWLWWVYRRLFRTARVFADLQVAVLSLYRWELYRSQRWLLPASSEQEVNLGTRLSEFLGRGTLDEPVHYQ